MCTFLLQMPKWLKGEAAAARDGTTAVTTITTDGAHPKQARKRTSKAQAMLEAPIDGGAGLAIVIEEEEPMVQSLSSMLVTSLNQAHCRMQEMRQHPSLSYLLVKFPPAPPILQPVSHTQQRAGDGPSTNTSPHAGAEAAPKQPT